jgi:transcriptional regulator with XRE-family HTH domain
MESGDSNVSSGALTLFCTRLKRLQAASGISQTSLVSAVHLGRSQISDILNGKIKRLPDWEVTSALVRACLGYADTKGRPVPSDLRDERDWRRRYADLEHDLDAHARSGSRRSLAPLPNTASKQGRRGKAQYLRAVIEEAEYVESPILGLLSSARIPLRNIFVSLQAASVHPRSSADILLQE